MWARLDVLGGDRSGFMLKGLAHHGCRRSIVDVDRFPSLSASMSIRRSNLVSRCVHRIEPAADRVPAIEPLLFGQAQLAAFENALPREDFRQCAKIGKLHVLAIMQVAEREGVDLR